MSEVYQRHGAFSWCELMTTDVSAAKQFYTQLLGWTTEDMPMPEMTYTVVKAGGTDVGGMMPIPPQCAGTPPRWGIYITVDDVDATVHKAEALGATTVVPPTDIPNVGRFATIEDPQGAMVSVITYLNR